jgi:hypothetical protein
LSVLRVPVLVVLPVLLLSGAAGAAPGPGARPGRGDAGAPDPQRLELLVRAGRAFQERRFLEAVGLYRRAWAIDPADGQPLVMAGVAAFESRSVALARQDLQQALQGRLDPADRELARTYLDLLGPEASGDTHDSAPAWTPSVTTTTGGGYDSNARQLPARDLDTGLQQQAAARSLFAAAGIQLALARALGSHLDLEARYAVEQRIHADRALADFDFLDQEAALELAARLSRAARLALTVSGDLSLSGAMTALRPFQRSLRIDPQLTLGDPEARLRLAVGWQRTSTLDLNLAFLSGDRFEVAATPSLTFAGWQLTVAGRLRRDRLGTARIASPDADGVCAVCLATDVVPYSNRAVAATARLAAPARWRLRPGLTARWETRFYDSPQHTQVQRPNAVEYRAAHLRQDQRLAAGAALSWRLHPVVVTTVRYEQSALFTTFTPAGPSTSGYRKQTVAVELSIDWL